MRQVGDPQQQIAQIVLDDVELVGQHPLVVAERATAQLQLLGTVACRRSRRNWPTAFDRSLTSARIASRLATMSRDNESKAMARSS